MITGHKNQHDSNLKAQSIAVLPVITHHQGANFSADKNYFTAQVSQHNTVIGLLRAKAALNSFSGLAGKPSAGLPNRPKFSISTNCQQANTISCVYLSLTH